VHEHHVVGNCDRVHPKPEPIGLEERPSRLEVELPAVPGAAKYPLVLAIAQLLRPRRYKSASDGPLANVGRAMRAAVPDGEERVLYADDADPVAVELHDAKPFFSNLLHRTDEVLHALLLDPRPTTCSQRAKVIGWKRRPPVPSTWWTAMSIRS
jgi:hypothetical protein